MILSRLRIFKEAGVAVLPGTAFGAYGEGYIRLVFSNSMENILAALDLIEGALRKLKAN